jgi:malate/lactate dehydrogenase
LKVVGAVFQFAIPTNVFLPPYGGGHDTTMIPLTRLASYNGIPVSQFLSEDAKVAADTMVGERH